MVEDLKIIKKHYGEKMAHLCRELFPTLLEEPGYLSKLMLDTFDPSRFLYEDIMAHNLKEQFKIFIYGHKDQVDYFKSLKTPKELLKEVGYDLYECHTEADIQKFSKYYSGGEELCTFNGGRLNRCYVFFAVKEGAEKLKRSSFKNPKRQDEYGTSVISIQFTRGEVNTLSIKNRYNETVDNPDATFSNNLDNIIAGLTDSFQKTYNLDLRYNSSGFEIPGYVIVNNKYFKYNYELDNIYYCVDNKIMDNFSPVPFEHEKVIVFDYFILDLQKKELRPYTDKIKNDRFTGIYHKHRYGNDPFLESIGEIKDIKVIRNRQNDNKTIYIKTNQKEIVEIELNKKNQMIRYKNNNIKKLPNGFLRYNKYLEVLELKNVITIGADCLRSNNSIKELYLNSVYEIGPNFLFENNVLERAVFPKNFTVEDGFLGWNQVFDNVPLKLDNHKINVMTKEKFVSESSDMFAMLGRAIKREYFKLYNSFIDKREVDFTSDEVTISEIKKTNAISALKSILISKKVKEQDLEKMAELDDDSKGIQI